MNTELVKAAPFQVVVSEKIQNRMDLAIATIFLLNSSIDQIFCSDIEFDHETDEKVEIRTVWTRGCSEEKSCLSLAFDHGLPASCAGEIA
jgi:hypothetical protein